MPTTERQKWADTLFTLSDLFAQINKPSTKLTPYISTGYIRNKAEAAQVFNKPSTKLVINPRKAHIAYYVPLNQHHKALSVLLLLFV